MIIPIALTCFGFWMSTVDFYYESPERDLTMQYYPDDQTILINKDLVLDIAADRETVANPDTITP